MRRYLLPAALTAALLLAAGCAGAPAASRPEANPGTTATAGFPLAGAGEAFGQGELSAFAQENLESFSTFVLSNGVPVVVKRSAASQVRHLSLVIRGGSLLADPAAAGYEGVALRTMARGAEGHPYAEIQDLLDATSSSIAASAGFDSSRFSLTTLGKYYERLFPVWAACLVTPTFAAEDFDQVLSEAKLALQSKEQDPWAKAALVANREFFAGHPYAAAPEGTEESLGKMRLEDARQWYDSRFSANRSFIVAVGDFDPAALQAELEATIGKLPDRRVPLPGPPPAIAAGAKAGGRLVKIEYPQSKGIGYLRGDFPAPSFGAEDYMATSIAMKMLADLLFNVVRDKYGATYSPGAYIRGFGANYGSLVIYKTKVAAQVKAYVDEAVAELAAGRCLSVDPTAAAGAEPRMGIAEALPIYKALFASEYYESQQTSAQIAGAIADSFILTGDYRTYLLGMERIKAVTPEAVEGALRDYLLGGNFLWVAIGSKDVVDPIAEADFAGFKGRR